MSITNDIQLLEQENSAYRARLATAENENQALRSALRELLFAKFDCNALAGGIEHMAASANAHRVLKE